MKKRLCIEYEGKEWTADVHGIDLEELAVVLAEIMKEEIFSVVAYKALAIHAQWQADNLASGEGEGRWKERIKHQE